MYICNCQSSDSNHVRMFKINTCDLMKRFNEIPGEGRLVQLWWVSQWHATIIQYSGNVRRAWNSAGRNSSHEDSSHELTPSEWSDWSEEGNLPSGCRGIVNPNYPGFQHLAPSLLSDTDLTEDEHESCPDYTRLNDIDTRPAENDNEYNNNVEDSINHLCGQRNERKIFYEKPKFNIQVNNMFTDFDCSLFRKWRLIEEAD